MQSAKSFLSKNLFTINQRSFGAVAATFRSSDLSIEQCAIRNIKPTTLHEKQFGQIFTDHMLSIDWSLEEGWAKP